MKRLWNWHCARRADYWRDRVDYYTHLAAGDILSSRGNAEAASWRCAIRAAYNVQKWQRRMFKQGATP